MKKRLFAILAPAMALLLLSSTFVAAQNLDADGKLPRSTPESVGVSSEAIVRTLQALDENFSRVDGVMILRGGKVIAEAYRPPFGLDVPHQLYSLSKSFCSTAVGFAIAEGKMALEQKVVDYFPDDLPESPDPRLRDITLEHILTMSCGQAEERFLDGMVSCDYGLEPISSDKEPTWIRQFFARPLSSDPGTTFFYNTTATYVASAMLQKAVGQTTRDYLVPRLFEPLHIETPFWESSPQGISKGGTGLFLKLEDVAKFGQFMLQRGRWNGEQLLPAEWVDAATAKQISNGDDPDNDWEQGYGYQFWRCRFNAYRCGGLYAQFCIVMPDRDAVVAILSDCDDDLMPRMLATTFDNLLPALGDSTPIPENEEALAKLRDVEKSFQPKEAGSGSEVYEQTVYSEALRRDVKYRVYVPNEYKTTARSYPTLYLLHGMFGHETDWSAPKSGNMKAICDEYFARNLSEKRIIVMPDGGNLWYRDSADDSCKYETFFFNELIPDVQRKYRCKTDRADRAIVGLSMGGYGCLLYALHRPDMFSSCYAMSAAIRTREEVATHSFEEFLKRYKSREDMKETDERFDEYYFANDPHSLVVNMPDEQKDAVRFLLDCGDDDKLLVGNIAFFQEARAKGVPCELRVGDGGHTWNYWRDALPKALEFIADK